MFGSIDEEPIYEHSLSPAYRDQTHPGRVLMHEINSAWHALGVLLELASA